MRIIVPKQATLICRLVLAGAALVLLLHGRVANAETDNECVARTLDVMWCGIDRKHDPRFFRGEKVDPPPSRPPAPPSLREQQNKDTTCRYGIFDKNCW